MQKQNQELINNFHDSSERLKKDGFLYVAALDFGTSNSGVVWGTATKDIIDNFNYGNRKQGESYAKVPTILIVHKSILKKLDNLENVKLVVNTIKENSKDEVNVYFGNEASRFLLDCTEEEFENWVAFEYFKMALYNGDGTVKGSDGKSYNLQNIIELYLRCIIKDAYDSMIKNGVPLIGDHNSNGNTRIRWGLTIPTVWDAKEKIIMENAAKKALDGQEPVFILEPEGAAMNFANNDNVKLDNGKVFMIVDCGGGTTDIVVQEVVQNGKFKGVQEVARSRGKAKAGWEMDKLFFKYLAETLAGYTDEIDKEHAYEKLIEAFYNEMPIGKIELDGEWQKYKHNTSKDLNYQIPQSYKDWLEEKYPSIIDKVKTKRGVRVTFTQNDIVKNVFLPVCREITSTIETVYEDLEKLNKKLDYVFGAGGLIALNSLQDSIRDSLPPYMDDKYCFFASNESRAKHVHGGAIMQGAACLLVFDDSIRRVSKRYYYFAEYDLDDPEHLWERYYKNHIDYQAFKKKYDEEHSAAKKWTNEQDDDYVFLLVPLLWADSLAAESSSHICMPSSDKNTCVKFDIYSSTNLHLFVDEQNVDIRKETDDKSGRFEVKPGSGQKYELTVNFNEFQQNGFEAVVKNAKSKQIMDTIKIKPEIKIGY